MNGRFKDNFKEYSFKTYTFWYSLSTIFDKLGGLLNFLIVRLSSGTGSKFVPNLP
jgi:hypothetical protein